MKRCSIKDCNKEYYSKSFCKMHYDKKRRHGDPLFEEVIARGNPCIIEGCDKLIWVNDMCAMHNRRNERHGDPLFINPKCNRDGNYIKRARKKTAQWKKDNPKLNGYYNTQRKNAIKQATPCWLDKSLLETIYINKPLAMEVDHILPIKGELISGLNVPCNLQYLTPFENNTKNDSFDGTYENESWRIKLKITS